MHDVEFDFYNEQTCPGPNGCVFSQTVTAYYVRDELRCPDGVRYTSQHALRWLDASGFVIENPSADALQTPHVRAPVMKALDRFEECFHATTASQQVRVEIEIRPTGTVLGVLRGASSCVNERLSALVFHRAGAVTLASWDLTYTVLDPNAYVEPRACW